MNNIDFPDIELPRNRARLKMALMHSRGLKKHMTLKKIIPAGVVAAIAIVAIVVFTAQEVPQASAKAIAQSSLQAIAQLSSQEQQDLNAHLQSQAKELLGAAERASDLTVIPASQVSGVLHPADWMDELTPADRESFLSQLSALDLSKTQFLQFTNASGTKVIIAIGGDHLPVYQVSDLEEVAVRNLVDNFGNVLKDISLLSPTAPQDIATKYKDFVTPDLLAEWEARPLSALGRVTSSPWPADILITGTQKTASDTYVVHGDVLEVTSAEVATNSAIAEPVTVTVKKVNGDWLIAAAQKESK